MTESYAIYIIVEGETEERFVKDILRPHLLSKNAYVRVQPIIVETGRKGGKKYKGGVSNYEKVKRDVQRVCKEHRTATVSTMFDLYGFPQDIDGQVWKGGDDVETVERMISKSIDSENFIPFLMKHETEALLFSDTRHFDDYGEVRKRLDSILSEYNGEPESINTTNSPSHRIEESFNKAGQTFSKITTGLPIYGYIGLAKMREKCPHFDEWISKLERSVLY